MLCQVQVFRRLGRGAHAAGGLEAASAAGFADGGQHHAGRFQRGVHRHLAGGGLDEIGAGLDRDQAGLADQRLVLQLAAFDDDFQHLAVAGVLAGRHQLRAHFAVTGHQRAIREHHIDFVRAVGDRGAGFRHRDGDVLIAGREVGDGGHFDLRAAGLAQGFLGDGHETRIHADRGHGAGAALGLAAQRGDLVVGVVVVQRGEIHQGQGAAGRGDQFGHELTNLSKLNGQPRFASHSKASAPPTGGGAKPL